MLLMVPEIALTPSVAALFPCHVRRPRGDSAQRAVRRRAARSMAPHPARRRGRRRRDTVGGVRAADPPRRSSSWTKSTTRPTNRKRRRDITAATSPSCAARDEKRTGRAGLGDAVDGDVSARPVRQVCARDARAADPRSAAGRRSGSSTCATSMRIRVRT